MSDNQEKINLLLQKLEVLLKRQDDFSKEISKLSLEIHHLKNEEFKEKQKNAPIIVDPLQKTPAQEEYVVIDEADYEAERAVKKKQFSHTSTKQPPKIKSDLEKFIGENLINKIGIAITVFGVAIGAKYSIEHDLISPLTRIILGYLAGIALLGIGMKLKKNYDAYSAVLVSGAITILYFITFAAYSFYSLYPQSIAFALMVIFTVFTVFTAIQYNHQIIAILGLVGAYAVPYLLSDGSGKVEILFSYMAIINAGILFISFKKYWKVLYYSSFALTWLIYLSWYVFSFNAENHFTIALTFASIFFIEFYLTFLAYKMLQKEQFSTPDILFLFLNSFIFYGIGYSVLSSNETGEQLLGIFTVANAIVHFIVSIIIYKKKLADKNLFYLVSGMVLIFVTIAIPVQLNGNWVTILWACQAALLFWIGRTKNVSFYERLSYIVMFIAFFSLLEDWAVGYNQYYADDPESRVTPLLNLNFLTSILFIAAFGFINYLNGQNKYPSRLENSKGILKIVGFLIPAIFVFSIYYAFRIEIMNYFDQLYVDSSIQIDSEDQGYSNYFQNYDLRNFKTVWVINYSLLFVSLLALLNHKRWRDLRFTTTNFILLLLTIGVFLTQGLLALSYLRESYISQSLSDYYQIGIFNLVLRYISFAFLSLALFSCFKFIKPYFSDKKWVWGLDLLLYGSIIWVLSSELIHWMNIADSEQSYKLGLSILWGICSLFLIAFGIWKNKKHLRIGAIGLFGITLIKLFFYDISHLNTISKTIVLVSLGVLLLIISFLYNKYKHVISDEKQN